MNPTMKNIAVGIACGSLFGLSFERSKVLFPSAIIGQLGFENFIVAKMFLGALATSSLSMLFLEKFGYKKRSCKAPRQLFGMKYADAIFGGLILGVGMYLTGSCPGTVYAQLGSTKIGSAIYAFIGAMIGALVYGLIEPKMAKDSLCTLENNDTIDKKSNIGYDKLALVMSALFLGSAYALEMFFPWKDDLLGLGFQSASSLTSIFDISQPHWHPTIAGAIIGFLQIPAGIFANTHLGSSTSFVSFIGSGLKALGVKSSTFSYFLDVSSQTFQKAMVIGVALGAFTSVTLSEVAYPEATFEPLRAILGGSLLLFGGRLANGCPTGHGITGIPQLSINSMLSVVSIFAGGIAAKAFGL